MNIQDYFKDQREYLKDNPEQYWFKAKLYGWGWTPVRWQGWAVIGAFVVLLISIASFVKPDAEAGDLVWSFFIPLIVLVTMLIIVCYKKGEKPRWQWGPPKKVDVEKIDVPLE
jgi:hypothetical protein